MKIICCAICLLAFVLIASSTFAQTKYIDSLKTELQNAKHDSTRLNIYIELADSGAQKDYLFYGEQVVKLADKLLLQAKDDSMKNKLLRKKANGYWIIVSYYYNGDHADLSQVNLYGEKIIKTVEALNDTENLIATYQSISQINLVQGNFPKAFELMQTALLKSKEFNYEEGIAFSYANIADMYRDQSENSMALANYENAITALKNLKDTSLIRNVLAATGGFYYKIHNLKKSLEYYNKVIALYKAQKMSNKVCFVYGWMGDAYKENNDLANALLYFEKSLPLFDSIHEKGKVMDMLNRIGGIYFKQNKMDSALYYHNRALVECENSKNDLGIAFTCLQLAHDYNKQQNFKMAEQFCNRSLSIFKNQFDIKSQAETELLASQIDSAIGIGLSALAHFKQYTLLNEKLKAEEIHKQAQREKYQGDFDKEKAIANAEQEKKNIRQRNIRNSITAGLAGVLIFLVVVYRQRNRIKKGKKLSDELLLNILPSEVAEELKAKGSAEAKQFDDVTVMFTDFKNFTQISEKLSPTELVNEIHTCFKAFDNIIGKHNIEKIKTIGDSYMCAGGLPVKNKTNAEDIVKAALEIQEYMNTPRDTDALSNGEVSPSGRFRGAVRIGIHTGPVVAGIVGVKKFAYDIWGDTVNIASRMESSGEAGKVNISGNTYELVKEKFKCTHRGKIQAKNKGEIDMYFVEQ
ncbi:MAG: adenylate/guanylate cyclase domain-containing protein [Bacteroidota bacterium]